jgi:hypothetical protein
MNPKLKLPWAASAVAIALFAAASTQATAKSNAGAIAAGIIAGAAVGAVVSSEINHPKKVYVEGPPPPSPWGQVYSPKPGIRCYPAQRACYKADGNYSATWTYRIYAR